MFENVDGRTDGRTDGQTDDGRTDGRRSDWYTISSPMSLRLRWAKNLGPKRKQNIPTVVYDENGNVQTDRNFVNHTWSRDFSNLYNTQDQTDFDSKFYDEMLQHKRLLEDNLNDPLYEQSPTLNSQISRGEVEKVVHRAKKENLLALTRFHTTCWRLNLSLTTCIPYSIFVWIVAWYHLSGERLL